MTRSISSDYRTIKTRSLEWHAITCRKKQQLLCSCCLFSGTLGADAAPASSRLANTWKHHCWKVPSCVVARSLRQSSWPLIRCPSSTLEPNITESSLGNTGNYNTRIAQLEESRLSFCDFLGMSADVCRAGMSRSVLRFRTDDTHKTQNVAIYSSWSLDLSILPRCPLCSGHLRPVRAGIDPYIYPYTGILYTCFWKDKNTHTHIYIYICACVSKH